MCVQEGFHINIEVDKFGYTADVKHPIIFFQSMRNIFFTTVNWTDTIRMHWFFFIQNFILFLKLNILFCKNKTTFPYPYISEKLSLISLQPTWNRCFYIYWFIKFGKISFVLTDYVVHRTKEQYLKYLTYINVTPSGVCL